MQAIIKPFEGNPAVTLRNLTDAVDEINKLYIERGFINSRAVILSNQDISNGILTVNLIEGFLEKIELEENNQCSNYIEHRVQSQVNIRPLNINNLEEQIRSLIADPICQDYEVEASLTPSNTSRSSILSIRAKKREGIDRIEQEIPVYQQELTQDPDALQTLNRLGVAYAKVGRLEDAIVEFKKALAINPNDQQIKTNLRETERTLIKKKKPLTGTIGVCETEYLPTNDSLTPLLRSVVNVVAKFPGTGREQLSGELGTGWVIQHSNQENFAYIITNRHVVFDSDHDIESPEVKIEVYLGDNLPNDRKPERLPAQIIDYTPPEDETQDLALLKVTMPYCPPEEEILITLNQEVYSLKLNKKVQPLLRRLPTSVKVEDNMPISIITYPRNGNKSIKISGNITHISEHLIDFSIAPGNGASGSPVLNSDNQVIGVVVQEFDVIGEEGRGFAIPIRLLEQQLNLNSLGI